MKLIVLHFFSLQQTPGRISLWEEGFIWADHFRGSLCIPARKTWQSGSTQLSGSLWQSPVHIVPEHSGRAAAWPEAGANTSNILLLPDSPHFVCLFFYSFLQLNRCPLLVLPSQNPSPIPPSFFFWEHPPTLAFPIPTRVPRCISLCRVRHISSHWGLTKQPSWRTDSTDSQQF